MFRLRVDPTGRYGRHFRPVAAVLAIALGIGFALLEARSSDRDPLAIFALLAAAAVGALVLLNRPFAD